MKNIVKYQKILLVAVFLSLFVFQQVQAEGKRLSVDESPSLINPAPANLVYLQSAVSVYLYELNPTTGSFLNLISPQICQPYGSNFGCGQPTYSVNGYATSCGNGCYLLDVEDDYLPNVVAIEMNLGSLPAVSEALKAQAVAVRSHVNWKVRNGPWDNGSSGQPTGSWPYINNSSLYAVYSPDNTNSAASTAVQETENQFLYYITTCSDGAVCHVVDAEFGNDVSGLIHAPNGNVVTLSGNTGNAPYLEAVEDPISNSGCGRPAGIGNQIGMIQLGADRWATGKTCPDGTGDNWPVNMPSPIKWDYKQILAHYYTGVEFKNDDTGANFAPNARWNLLKYDLPSTTATVGVPFIVNVTLQNTSATNTNWSDVVIGYKWNDGSWTVLPNNVSSTPLGNPPVDLALSISVPASLPANSTLHLDLGHQIDSQTVHWFSQQSPAWPDARIPVQVNNSSITPVPTTPPSTSNYALRFQSPSFSQGIMMPEATALDFSGDMTIEFWIRTTSAYGGGAWHDAQWILDKDIPGGGQADWAVVAYNGHIVFDNGNPGGGDQPLQSVQAVNNGPWHHVAITRNTSTENGLTTIYIDGVQDTSGLFSTASIGNPFALTVGVEGGPGSLNPRAFRGDLDDLRLWNIARSQAEIQENMHVRLQGNETGLAGYWNFDEGEGQIVGDGSPYNTDGQLGSYPSSDDGDPEWIIASEIFTGTPPTPVPTTPGPTITPIPATPPPFCGICDDGCPSNSAQQLSSRAEPLGTPDPQASASESAPLALQAGESLNVTDTAILLYRVRDEILSTTSEGQRLTDLYYTYIPNIIQVLIENPEVSDQSMEVLDLFIPSLQALVDGDGYTVTITTEQADGLQSFLDALVENGDPELQAVILAELETHPPEDMIGLTMDNAWVYLNGFPSTSILDDFNRTNSSIGSNWGGEVSSFAISSNRLTVDDYGAIYWKGEPFGADQEVFVTLTTIDEQASEHNLLLKSQSNYTYGDGVLEVSYDAVNHNVQVWTWDWPQGWVQHGTDIPVTFEDGDQFGARAFAEGTVEVYRNGNLLATRDITSWQHYADSGYIGLWLIGAEDSVSDDFGGGTIPADPVTALPTMDDFNRANGPIGSNWSGATNSYSISSNQMQVGSASYGSEVYWNSTIFGADQEAHFTFSQVNTSATAQGLVLKAQNAGSPGSGLLEVLYVAPLKSVQIWTYTPSQGMVQRGDNIPVIFSNGDQFSARAFANGALEVYKNGVLFARRDITAWPLYPSGGYIGMGFVNANGAKVDDFGGGTLSVGEGFMAMSEGLNQSNLLGGGFELETVSDSFDVTLDSPNLFWQGVPLGLGEEATVTFTQLNTTLARQKPQSNGLWGEDVVQVFYDVAERRIQVWMYDPQAGWVQYGRDIPAKFSSGDQFSVRVLDDGTVEIYRNGKLLAKRDVTP